MLIDASGDWTGWQPDIRATLMFVCRDDQVLLIHKKRGFGMGKVNGPGGKIDLGETPLEAVVRETQEEVCITPLEPELAGELHFHFLDSQDIHCLVYRSVAHEGQAEETEEAAPFWCQIDDVPYDKMWADDRHWLPGVLGGKFFRAWFVFQGDTMRSMRVKWAERLEYEGTPEATFLF